ncbi:hypothetical protein [Streptomyces sp. NPDC046832]|uniref:hypothetical protein n=1 Tax=Streptomyces sp. NPDC046832 TaxID=3155020 RepID=UPI0033CD3D32
MVELEYKITDAEGRRTVACADTAAAVVLGVVGELCAGYPIDAIAEVMTRVGAPLWREITTHGRQALSEGRSWEYRTARVFVCMKPATAGKAPRHV